MDLVAGGKTPGKHNIKSAFIATQRPQSGAIHLAGRENIVEERARSVDSLQSRVSKSTVIVEA